MRSLLIVMCVITVLLLSSCQLQQTYDVKQEKSSEIGDVVEKWKAEDGMYLGSDEFGEDLEKISGELYKSAKDLGGYTEKEEAIWKYCQDRWNYYDRLEGGYSGDKYTNNVFQDAGNEFGITAKAAEAIWAKVDKAKLGIDY